MEMYMENQSNNRPILYEYFNSTANVILAEYERSKQQNASNNLGKNRELFCKQFLSNVLPPKLSIKSGEIWDSSNNKTGQLDIVILRDDAPSLNIGSDDIYLAEGVFAVIEIKSNLDRAKLIEAGNGLAKVNKLKVNMGVAICTDTVLNRPLRVIFAYEGATWETLIDEINKQGWYELFDLICILNRGVLIKRGRLLKWEGNSEFMAINGKSASLGFLYFYMVSYSSNFLGRSLVLNPYFEPLNFWNN